VSDYELGQRVRVTAMVVPDYVYETGRGWSSKSKRILNRVDMPPNVEGVYVGRRYRYEGEVDSQMEAQSIWTAKKRHTVLLVATDERTIVEAFPADVGLVEATP
jgi:hypothetical protein